MSSSLSFQKKSPFEDPKTKKLRKKFQKITIKLRYVSILHFELLNSATLSAINFRKLRTYAASIKNYSYKKTTLRI